MGWYLPHELSEEQPLICNRTGSTLLVKSCQLGGNPDTFMSLFSADTLEFAVSI